MIEANDVVRPAPPDQCSRDLSRNVRDFLHREVFPKIGIDPTLLPKACQLNPLLDPYREQEKNKVEVQKGEWRCLYCSKVDIRRHRIIACIFFVVQSLSPTANLCRRLQYFDSMTDPNYC